MKAHLPERKHYVLNLLLMIEAAAGDLEGLVCLACDVGATCIDDHTRAVVQRVVDAVEDVKRKGELLHQRELNRFRDVRVLTTF